MLNPRFCCVTIYAIFVTDLQEGACMNGKKITSVLKLILLSVLLGVIGGVLGTLFSKGVSLVTNLRGAQPWLLYLLPLAGVLSVALYRWLNVTDMGTNHVLRATNEENVLSPNLTPAIFFASLLSHCCGASVGREGAALQLGGSSAVLVSKWFKLSQKEGKLLIYCGMAGVFSSVFGTPFAAAAFALEVVFVGHICWQAAIPVLITSFTSYGIAHLLGAHAERFVLTDTPAITLAVTGKVLLLGLLMVGLSYLFCLSLEYSEKLMKTLFKNPYLRIAVGGTAIIGLTLLVGSYDYNGAGVAVIERIFSHNEFVPYAFALKILFTCIAVGSGFKGGEIVPTLFIGATFGALAGTLLGLPAAFAAALGMTALFCGVTNCPLASILLAAELFSGKGMGMISLSVIITYCLSGKISLYSAQKTSGLKKLF